MNPLGGGSLDIVQALCRRMEKRRLVVLVALAALVRLAIVFHVRLDWWTEDSQPYFDMADAILAGEPMNWFPNAYPLIIAGLGLAVPDALVPSALVLINVVLSSVIVALTYHLARSLVGETASLFSAAIVALHPNQLNYVGKLMTEVPALFVLMLGFFLFLHSRLVLAGLAFGLAAWFRATLLPVPVLLGALLVKRGAGWRSVALLFAGLASVLVVSNGLEFSGIVGRPTAMEFNLVISSHGPYLGEKVRPSPDQFAHPWRTYLGAALRDPGSFVAERFLSLWYLWGPYARELESPMRRWFMGLARFPLFLLSLAGVTYALRRKVSCRYEILTFFVPILSVSAIHTMFYSNLRYTFVMEPFAVILSVWTVSALMLGESHGLPRFLQGWCGTGTRPR